MIRVSRSRGSLPCHDRSAGWERLPAAPPHDAEPHDRAATDRAATVRAGKASNESMRALSPCGCLIPSARTHRATCAAPATEW